MNRIASGVAVLALSMIATATVLAQASFAEGTWKMNPDKSKYVSVPAPKSMTRTAEKAGDRMKVNYQGEAADGSAITYDFTAAYDSKDAPVNGSGMPFGADTIALKRLNPNTTESTLKKDGAVVGKSRASLSPDGKTLTVMLQDAGGKPTGDTAVYDKQ